MATVYLFTLCSLLLLHIHVFAATKHQTMDNTTTTHLYVSEKAAEHYQMFPAPRVVSCTQKLPIPFPCLTVASTIQMRQQLQASTADSATLVTTTSTVQDGVITGVIRDTTGELIAGATVLVEGTKRGAYSHRDGRFTIKKLLPGTYTLRIKSIGYMDTTITAIIRTGEIEHCDILLYYDNREVIVENLGCGYPRIHSGDIGTIRRITAEDIQRSP